MLKRRSNHQNDEVVSKQTILQTFEEDRYESINDTKYETRNNDDIIIKKNTNPTRYSRNNNRIFHDSVHGTIKLDPLLEAIIDTPQFQRLRDIKQLGVSYWVFPGGCHNRFEHSIGTSHLCGIMLSTLRDLHHTVYDNQVEITDTEILCVKIAGLCHDLGHGPFSHVFDGRFMKRMDPDSKWTHEIASTELFNYMVESNPELQDHMNERGIGTKERELIKRMIIGRNPKNEYIPETCTVDGNEIPKWFLYEIVSNKRTGIDCDKFDYFARDTHAIGIKNGFDHLRFFQNVRILAVDNQLQICVRDKEMFNAYELFRVRWALHHQVYQHKTIKVIEEMICRAFQKVDALFGLSSAKDDMSRYTYLTDSIFFDILRSTNPDPGTQEAKDLLNRIQKRQLYRLCGQINPDSTRRKSEETTSSQPVSSESQVIRDEILNQVDGEQLNEKDVFVDIISISYGMKSKNPVEELIFFSKDGQPRKLRRDQLSEILPTAFTERHIRVYSTEDSKREILRHAFELWCIEKGYFVSDSLSGNISGYFTDIKKTDEESEKQTRLLNRNQNDSVRRTLVWTESD